MILTSGTIGYLGSNIVLFSLATIAFIGSIKILKSWDFNSTTVKQYTNEKLSFLVSTIIKFLLLIKILLSFYLLYLLDSLVPFIKAAMCGVGVVNATSFGWELLTLKIVLIILFGLWLTTDSRDTEELNYPYLKFKFIFFIIIFILMCIEIFLDIHTITSLDTERVVSCCSVTFSNKTQIGEFFSLSIEFVGMIFMITFLLYFIFGILSLYKNLFITFFGSLSIILTYVGILALIYTFSPYVYELPTHTCPFCIIQKEYYYIGYLFYLSLIIGCFYGIKSAFSYLFLDKINKNDIIISLVLNTIFTLLGIYYVIGYYITNGVWL